MHALKLHSGEVAAEATEKASPELTKYRKASVARRKKAATKTSNEQSNEDLSNVTLKPMSASSWSMF